MKKYALAIEKIIALRLSKRDHNQINKLNTSMKRKFFLFTLAALTITACSKENEVDKLNVNQEKVALRHDETFQFELKLGTTPIKWDDISIAVEDTTIGNVNKQGLFSANKVGETSVRFKYGNTSVQSDITIVPYQNLFAEPIINWNADKSEIRAKETRTFQNETATVLSFKGENADLRNVMYMFRAGKMNGAALLFPTRTDLVEKVAKFFQERYTLVGADSDIIYFESRNVIIGLGVDNSLGFNAIYMNPTSAATKAKLSSVKKVNFSDGVKLLLRK